MPYPTPTLRIQFGGTINGDIWRCGFDLSFTDPSENPSPTEMQAAVAAVQAEVQATWTGYWKGLNSSGVRLNTVGGLFYPAGATVATQVDENIFAGDPGTGVAGFHPNGVCIAIDKITAFSGRRNRGRMYVPLTTATLSTDGQFTQATTIQANNGAKNLFDDVNAINWAGLGMSEGVVVVTSVTRSDVPFAVIAVAADSVPDYQRRRKSEQAPSWSELAPVVP